MTCSCALISKRLAFGAAILILGVLTMTLSSAKPGGMRERKDNAPKVGDTAPDFRLSILDSEDEVTLSSFKTKKNVVLIFGSYT